LGRLLLAASGGPLLEDAATLAALIQEGKLEGIDALAQVRSARSDESVRRARAQLVSSLGFGLGGGTGGGKPGELGECVLAGFPDRVGRVRKAELLLSSGGSARFEGAQLGGEFFVVLDLQEKQGHAQARSWIEVRSVCPIKEEWLFDLDPPIVKEEEKLHWDPDRKRVLAVSQLACGALVLAEDKKAPEDPEAAARVLIRDGLGVPAERMPVLEPADLIRALSGVAEPEAVEGSLARIALLARHFPELGAPSLDSQGLASLLVRLTEGKLSLEELKDSSVPDALIGLLPDEARARIDRLLPLTIMLPGGRKPKVQYKLGQAPWIESRLQDFFGMKEGPSLLGGRLPLTLHLLAPNYRAVQVTTDLAGFWQRAYREVRRELSRNYPKHSWPENPLEAEPPRPRKP
jgi:ATP-dependent helicase HrpB